ncbi:hypothetical protein PENSPDRAFT_756061 [Peniophora sp. CONT]|nr:hypothetical protein PENSPDRAFT_756061 [Peniophora sp. CONT]
MSTSAQNAAHGTEGQTGNVTQNRMHIHRKAIEDAKAVAKTAVGVLSMVAEATENVPYLGAVSKALTAFKGVLDEIIICKEDCKATINDAHEFKELLQKSEARWDLLESSGDGELRKEFDDLGRSILECLETLQALKVDSKRQRDRFKLLFKRDEVQASVGKCRERIRVAKEKFNTAVALDTNFMVHGLHKQHTSKKATQVLAPTVESTWHLRGEPLIFYGRESEVEHAVKLIVHQAPARVAILGTGGIGKTSIALTILHRPEVKALYGDRRCFVSCEAATTVDGVVRALIEALDSSKITSGLSPESTQRSLFHYLKSVTGIICLDNLETPWDADTVAVEEFLAEFAHLPFIALLITSRVTDTPLIAWSEPPLEPIMPFTLEAALQTWDAICSNHDEYALSLLKAVDCVPLAVTLLSRLARTETAMSIWARWEKERTGLIRTHGAEHRLNNLDISIDLSLRALGCQDAIDVLGVICIFHAIGLDDHEISKLDDALTNRLSLVRAITSLKQLSLIYTETGCDDVKHIHVLSPIRHYIQKHHVSDELFLTIADLVMQSYGFWPCRAIVEFGWNRQGRCRARCFELAISDPHLSLDVEMVFQAIERARELDPGPHIQSRLHRQLGWLLSVRGKHEDARSSFRMAIEHDEHLGDTRALFTDWTEWISICQVEFRDREDECQRLDEVQSAIHKAWDLGCNEDGVWNQGFRGYDKLAMAQHFVNEGRRKLHMPVIHRSNLFSDNDSTVWIDDIEAAYEQLVSTSPPPWNLSMTLQTIEASQGPLVC